MDFAAQGVNIEEAIEKQGEVISSSSGYSMYPMLRNRKDMVVIVKPQKRPTLHDVVLYRTKGGKLLLHRIIKDMGEEYIIRADNRFNKEYGVTPEAVIGVLKGFYRKGKYFDCNESKVYKLYVFYNRTSLPFRFLWRKTGTRVVEKIRRMKKGEKLIPKH